VNRVSEAMIQVLGGGGPREIERVGELARFAGENVIVVAREKGGFGRGGPGGEDFHVGFGDVVVGGGFDTEFVLALRGREVFGYLGHRERKAEGEAGH